MEEQNLIPSNAISPYSGQDGHFEKAWQIATALAATDLVPKEYKGKPENCVMALDLSIRLNMSPLMVMQNLDIIHGRPSFRSVFLIGLINSSGQYKQNLRYHYTGEGDTRSCWAYAIPIDRTEPVYGPPASIQMARAEGWYSRAGSKWPNMPDLMLAYRAAAFFARLYCPEMILGMHDTEEAADMGPSMKEGTISITQLNKEQ